MVDPTSGTVTRYDPATGAATGPIRVGNGPTDITTGLGAVWVANYGDRTLSRIDAITNDSEEVPVGVSPAAVAADPKGHQLWMVVVPAT